MTTAYVEDQGSPVERWGDDGFTATRQLRTNWSTRHSLAFELLSGVGASYENSPTIGATARDAAISPVPAKNLGAGTVSQYEQALLTVQYDTKRELVGTSIVSESWEPNAEFMTEDFNNFRWGQLQTDDALKEGEAPGRLVRGADYVLTFFQVPDASVPDFKTLPGSINNAIITASLINQTFPIGTLLFQQPVMTRTITTNVSITGIPGWNITYRFSYRKDTWNKYWRPSVPGYASIYTKPKVGNGVLYVSYPEADFSPVLP